MSVVAAFGHQAQACAALGSPLTAQLCRTLPDVLGDGPVGDRVLGWQGDPSTGADSVPLRLCGALHALVLTGRAPDLARAYDGGQVNPSLLRAALNDYVDFILSWLDSPPQTNEVARAAPLIGAARFLGALSPLPLRLLELGASAGMNLNFDRYHLGSNGSGVVLTPEWRGTVPQGPVSVASRRGVDLNPLDPDRDGLRLMAYCWADQHDRMARLRAALDIARKDPPQVDRGDAGAWLTDQLAAAVPDRLTLVYHTVAAQYFPPATVQACDAALIRAGQAAALSAPVAHLRMEADGGDGAALDLTLWDGARRDWSLGRADFHGRWIDWQPKQL
ncbi:DUF2332 domain-containing protein [Paracoccus sp. Ld10]|uniref:DUF2332 domain-containing protein n=1 Tax=Paracoccus sp. Ld10 TaxID=649158 RepID=UPI003864E182